MKKRITALIVLAVLTSLGIIIIISNKNKPYEITDSNNGQFAFFYEDDNGEYQRSDESKWSTGEYILNFENSSCNGEKDPSFLSWNNDNNSVILMRNKATKCNLYFDRKAYNFSYTGDVQEFTAPVEGDYKIELWGAQGGDSGTFNGGKGAYATGIIHLKDSEKLYIYTGEQGHAAHQNYNGTFNGGAEVGLHPITTEIWGGTGGGATDIRLNKGNNWKDFYSLKSRIMVAAGGGGASSRSSNCGDGKGGDGGALKGIDGQIVNNIAQGYGIGLGASQVSGGKSNWYSSQGSHPTSISVSGFGYSGPIYALHDCRQGCDGLVKNSEDLFAYSNQNGGGGGYYGGGSSTHGSSGGGSSYISGYQGCVAIKDTSTEGNVVPKDNCTEENALNNIECSYHYSGKTFQNANMIAGDSIMPSPTGGNETGHSGNGYARITLVDIPKVYDFSFKEEVQEFIAPINGNYKIELWGASGGDYEGYYGGKGAYTAGIINLKKNDKLYIYTGQQGFYGNTELVPYNGGGKAYWTGYGATGGGATDVRLAKTDWKDFDSLKSRIMVAAGGGGANNRNKLTGEGEYYGAGNGGAGGALVGINGEIDLIAAENPISKTIWGYFYGTGGSQTKAGTGVIGPNCVGNINADFKFYPSEGYFGYANVNQSTGGGGYFGGGGGEHAGGGGGSSFISGYQGCIAIEGTSSEENIISKCTEESAKNNISCSYHYSGKIFTNTIMKAGNEMMPSPSGGMETGHLGNGYARITLVSGSENVELKKAIDLSGNDYNGEFIGNAVIKKDGDDGYGIYFDGNKSYVDLGTLPSTIEWEKGFTIEFEIKCLEHRNWSRVFDFGNGYPNDDLVFYLSSTVGGYGFDIFKGTTLIENNFTTGLSLNVKTKIKIIYKSSEKQVELYKDDNLVQTVSVSDTINNIDRKHCYLGKSNVEYDPYFNGYIYSFKLSDSTGKPIIWYNFN